MVPFTSFCEYEDTKPKKTPVWFAGDESRPLMFFAGLWTTWHGTRGTKADPVEGEHHLSLPDHRCDRGGNPSHGHAGYLEDPGGD